MNAAAHRTLATLALLVLTGSSCSEPTATAQPVEGAKQADEVTVELELLGKGGGEQRSFASGTPIRLRLTLRNPTEREVKLVFSSGRTHDAVVLGANGSEVWRWSNGRFFTQSLSKLQLAPGSESSFELVCDLSQGGEVPLPPGRYRAAGVIPAFAEELRSLMIEFEIQ